MKCDRDLIRTPLLDSWCSFTRSLETGLALTITFLCFHSLKGFFGGGKSIHRRRLGGCALSPRWCGSSSNYRGWQVEARRQKHASLATTRFAAPSLRQPQHEEPSTKKPKPIKVSALNQLYRVSCWNQFEFTHFHQQQVCAYRCLMMNAWWSWRESPGLLCWWKLDLGPPLHSNHLPPMSH